MASNDSPKEHQKQGDGTQILPICECWELEDCDHTDSQGYWDHIHELWRKDAETERHEYYISKLNSHFRIKYTIDDYKMLPYHKGSLQSNRRARWCLRCAEAFWPRCCAHWLHRWQSWQLWSSIPSARIWPRGFEAFPGYCENINKDIDKYKNIRPQ